MFAFVLLRALLCQRKCKKWATGVGKRFGEVLYLDSLGNGLGEGLEAERASRDYGLRIVGQEVSYRGLGDLGTVTRIQSKAAETASAADALIAFLGGFHQRAGLGQNLTRLFIDSTATAQLTRIVIDYALVPGGQFKFPFIDKTFDELRVMEHFYAIESIFILKIL